MYVVCWYYPTPFSSFSFWQLMLLGCQTWRVCPPSCCCLSRCGSTIRSTPRSCSCCSDSSERARLTSSSSTCWRKFWKSNYTKIVKVLCLMHHVTLVRGLRVCKCVSLYIHSPYIYIYIYILCVCVCVCVYVSVCVCVCVSVWSWVSLSFSVIDTWDLKVPLLQPFHTSWLNPNFSMSLLG